MDKFQKQNLISKIKERFVLIKPHLSERVLKLWAAAESISIGRGGDTIVNEATGLSRVTISKGRDEIKQNKSGKTNHQTGRGRKSLVDKYPKLMRVLDGLIYPFERKEPVPTLRWTQDSTYEISRKLRKKGYEVTQKSIYSIMLADGYIMHTNQKRTPEKLHPHFGMQFDYIYEKVKEFREQGFPAISLDLRKYVGQKDDFTLHDLMKSEAWEYTVLEVGTIKFAVQSIQTWWLETGQSLYPNAGSLLLTLNGLKTEDWEYKIQDLSNLIGIPIQVCHFPPGIRKWDQVESQTYSFMACKLSYKLVQGFCSIVNLVSPVKEESEDTRESEFKEDIINVTEDVLRGEWNYMVLPLN